MLPQNVALLPELSKIWTWLMITGSLWQKTSHVPCGTSLIIVAEVVTAASWSRAKYVFMRAYDAGAVMTV